jgi:MFS family permease
MSVAAEVFFARDVLDAGAAGYGVLVTAWTLGMVAGAVGLARRVPSTWLAAAALAGVALQGAGLLGAAVGATMATALAAFLVGGVAHGTKNVVLRTLIHERVAEHQRGRAFASYNALRNGAELGALGAGGVLVGVAGAQVALALSGAIPLAIGLAALALLGRRVDGRVSAAPVRGYGRGHERAPARHGRLAPVAARSDRPAPRAAARGRARVRRRG